MSAVSGGPSVSAGPSTPPSDVLIVGAGPAGSSLALRLARAGVRTTIVDASAFPRSKPCGDAISPGAAPLLRELGLEGSVEASGAARIVGWRLRSPAGRWFSGRFAAEADPPADGATDPPAYGLAAPRSELDALLLEGAVAAGARFLPRRRIFDLLRGPEPGAGVRIRGVLARDPEGRHERLAARFVVGADGLRSRVARRLGGVRRGRRDRLAVVGRFEGSGLGAGFGAWGEMRISAEGVLGAAPTGRDRCTLALVVPRRRAPEISADRKRFYRRRLEAYGAWARLEGARRTGPLEVTGPFEVSPRRLTAPGALLTGDAAGYLDPFTGQGIYRALRLAREAAEAALEALERPAAEEQALARYARLARRLFRPSRRAQRLIDAVVSRPRLLEPAARALGARPGLAALLVDVTGDRIPAGALVDPIRLTAALLGLGGRARAAPRSPGRPPPHATAAALSSPTATVPRSTPTTRSHHAPA